MPSYISQCLPSDTPEGYETLMERPLTNSGTFPTKLHQIILCSCSQFGWCLQNKAANQSNSVLLFCTNLESSRTLLFFFKRTYQQYHKLFDVLFAGNVPEFCQRTFR